MNNVVFQKTMENVQNDRFIKFFTAERRRNYLLSEISYHATKFFTEKLLPIELKKPETLMNSLSVYDFQY